MEPHQVTRVPKITVPPLTTPAPRLDADSTVLWMSGLVTVLVVLLAFTTGTVFWQWRELDRAKRALNEQIQIEAARIQEEKNKLIEAQQRHEYELRHAVHVARIVATASSCPVSSCALRMIDPDNPPKNEPVVELEPLDPAAPPAP